MCDCLIVKEMEKEIEELGNELVKEARKFYNFRIRAEAKEQENQITIVALRNLVTKFLKT